MVAIYGIYCNENIVLHKPIASEFITMACIDFFVVAITLITTTLVVIATTFYVVLSIFSCSESIVELIECWCVQGRQLLFNSI